MLRFSYWIKYSLKNVFISRFCRVENIFKSIYENEFFLHYSFKFVHV